MKKMVHAFIALALTTYASVSYIHAQKATETTTAPAAATQQTSPVTLSFRTGPILGYAGTDFFTVTCQSTIPAEATLKVAGKSIKSPSGTDHLFKAEGLSPGTEYEYTITLRSSDGAEAAIGPFKTKTYTAGNKFTFAAMGDSRGDRRGPSKFWGQIAARVIKAKPMFVLHNGDMIDSGRKALWNEMFWEPAKELCVSTPIYGVIGNHEIMDGENPNPNIKGFNEAFFRRFAVPGGTAPWSQQINNVLLVGLTLGAAGADGKYLDQQLKDSKAAYIFVLAHTPAWSTAKKGSEKSAQTYIFPVMEKYKATAMIAGDRHCYERLEPGNGTTMIVLGNGGAPLYDQEKPDDNKFSKVFKKEYGYALFEVDADKCVMKAYNIDGGEIDTRTWEARKID